MQRITSSTGARVIIEAGYTDYVWKVKINDFNEKLNIKQESSNRSPFRMKYYFAAANIHDSEERHENLGKLVKKLEDKLTGSQEVLVHSELR